jgi:branched-subunit amino acid aminotransferase/4-amino-4-deoxychorismate lyase
LVIDGVLHTPPTGPGVVAGVTRELVLDWSAMVGLPSFVRACTYQDLRAADEALLTSSAFGIVSVTTVDSHRVGAGQRGPMGCALRGDYLTRLMDLWLGTCAPRQPRTLLDRIHGF